LAATPAAEALAAIRKSLPAGWIKRKSEAARFAAFRELPLSDRLDWLGYSVALTLQPKLAPATIDDATAYDAALDLTGGKMAGYWRPRKDSYLGRITRDQLLALGRDTLGESWAQSRAGDKKASLVEQLDRAFADPAKHGRTPEQVEKLKNWLPAGMALGFHIWATATKKKARKDA
jgi:ParB family transcriptional regulator, chromosome partitioning protein